MRELALAGLIAITFALGSFYATGKFGPYAWINLALGGVALAFAVGGGIRRFRVVGTSAARRRLAKQVGVIAILVLASVGLERATNRLGWRFDWTLDRRFTLAPATRKALAELPDGLRATLYYDAGDPRIRSTRMLLESFARTGEVTVRERVLDDAGADLDTFGLTSSNSVVLEVDHRFEVVERPTEGSLWEGLLRLARPAKRLVLYVARGEGEGYFGDFEDRGFSGLGIALQTEGYTLRDLVLAAVSDVPDDAAALLIIAPRRPLRELTLGVLRRYLEGGGRLVVLLDPGPASGIEVVLEEFGFDLPQGVVIDPASGPVEGGAPGVNPILFAYSDHPVTNGLDSNTMTFFLRARPVEAVRKPEPEDRLESLVYSSPEAWLDPNVEAIDRGATPRPPPARERRRFSVAAAGRYPRRAGEARIVVFGDSDFASNRDLRALYNLDLVVNAIHWTTAREPDITRRAKALTPNVEPLTPQETLTMLYGVGLLLPEILSIAAAVIWIRRRSA